RRPRRRGRRRDDRDPDRAPRGRARTCARRRVPQALPTLPARPARPLVARAPAALTGGSMHLTRWLLVVLAACQSDVSLGGPNTLVRVDHEANGPDCPGGGVAIH